jgi:hypothetical protein
MMTSAYSRKSYDTLRKEKNPSNTYHSRMDGLPQGQSAPTTPSSKSMSKQTLAQSKTGYGRQGLSRGPTMMVPLPQRSRFADPPRRHCQPGRASRNGVASIKQVSFCNESIGVSQLTQDSTSTTPPSFGGYPPFQQSWASSCNTAEQERSVSSYTYSSSASVTAGQGRPSLCPESSKSLHQSSLVSVACSEKSKGLSSASRAACNRNMLRSMLKPTFAMSRALVQRPALLPIPHQRSLSTQASIASARQILTPSDKSNHAKVGPHIVAHGQSVIKKTSLDDDEKRTPNIGVSLDTHRLIKSIVFEEFKSHFSERALQVDEKENSIAKKLLEMRTIAESYAVATIQHGERVKYLDQKTQEVDEKLSKVSNMLGKANEALSTVTDIAESAIIKVELARDTIVASALPFVKNAVFQMAESLFQRNRTSSLTNTSLSSLSQSQESAFVEEENPENRVPHPNKITRGNGVLISKHKRKQPDPKVLAKGAKKHRKWPSLPARKTSTATKICANEVACSPFKPLDFVTVENCKDGHPVTPCGKGKIGHMSWWDVNSDEEELHWGSTSTSPLCVSKTATKSGCKRRCADRSNSKKHRSAFGSRNTEILNDIDGFL